MRTDSTPLIFLQIPPFRVVSAGRAVRFRTPGLYADEKRGSRAATQNDGFVGPYEPAGHLLHLSVRLFLQLFGPRLGRALRRQNASREEGGPPHQSAGNAQIRTLHAKFLQDSTRGGGGGSSQGGGDEVGVHVLVRCLLHVNIMQTEVCGFQVLIILVRFQDVCESR